ncbi:unnamed protein product [Mytilus coruscus]|uniref:Uncharacterized protein n=1 Tax=Mytilus coruscus TaxID=42192 RepID=A0A6J7ZU70_MYTCO|nr:unnamed protein product [Mytilus coruscus]
MEAKSSALVSAALDSCQQGQAIVRSKIDQKKMSLVSSFLTDIFGKNVSIYKGCFIPTGRLPLSPLIGNNIFICNLDGTKAETVQLDYTPHSVTLNDNEQALVTSFNGRFVQTVNLTTLKPGKKIYFGTNCGSITSSNGRICLSTSQSSFIITNLYGDVLKKTTTKLDSFDISINRAGDCYYTGNFNNVYVLPVNSEEPILYNEMSDAHRITAGDHNCIYVSRRDLNEIIRISKNNEEYKIDNLLNADDGIELPTALSYDNDTKQLMIINNAWTSIHIYNTR